MSSLRCPCLGRAYREFEYIFLGCVLLPLCHIFALLHRIEMKRPIRRNRNVFRFKDLPEKLRNRIYAEAIDRTNPFEFPVSHRFNSRLPLLDRQVNREASTILFAIPNLAFRIDGLEALTSLPLKLKKAEAMPLYRTCRLEFFLMKWNLLDGKDDHNLMDLGWGRFKKALSLVAEQLSTMPKLEELQIGCFGTLPITGTEHELGPDDLMDCFQILRRFKHLTIEATWTRVMHDSSRL